MASLRLDSAGISEILNSPKVASAVESLGNAVAANVSADVSGEPIDVDVRMRVASGGRLRGERPAADITMLHPAALRVEAKRAPLARAAAAAGLEVKSRKAAK